MSPARRSSSRLQTTLDHSCDTRALKAQTSHSSCRPPVRPELRGNDRPPVLNESHMWRAPARTPSIPPYCPRCLPDIAARIWCTSSRRGRPACPVGEDRAAGTRASAQQLAWPPPPIRRDFGTAT
ncbi:hypothetical protein C8T65DRAFT_233462 [Cerioporus squamosus]|nr:hypothetical protein C8T65DRAFT_233462 [Cerioporus squamosus]